MYKWISLLVLAGTPALVLGQSLRCSDKIIGEGATRLEVSSLCGDPAQVEHKTIYKDASAGAQGVSVGTTTEIQLEAWTYNFGPDRLMQRIWLEDGVVIRIESLGYGF